ncbi:MAG: tRNA uracil 4-sulfurtransferase ThiI [Christensenellales bacterium]
MEEEIILSQTVIMIRYGEIHLKGQNRPFFEKKLVQNIKEAVKDIPCRLTRGQGRYLLRDFDEPRTQEVIGRIRKVFGVHSLCVAQEMEKDFDVIAGAAIELLAPMENRVGTFKVRARRADKNFPLQSPELSARLGEKILDALPWLRVDVVNPQAVVDVEIREMAYVYCGSVPCAGGMPVGTGGKAALLLSGGIDSPVAGHMMAKRGVELSCVYFHSFPYTSEHAKQKVIDLAAVLSSYAGRIPLYVVNFTPLQNAIYEKCPEEQVTLLMRRMMMRVAEGIAKKANALSLVTGESLGQVASQTMESLACTNAVVGMPVFRPLIGFDKIEIMDRAREIGTYDLSILPYQDCCTVFVPKHPVTKPKPKALEAAEARWDYQTMVQEAIDTAETIEI